MKNVKFGDSFKLSEIKLYKLTPYFLALGMMVLLTIIIAPFKPNLGLVNISMIFLLPVLLSAAKWGIGPALVAAGAGVVTFDFFFVPPILTFTVSDVRYIVSFFIFLMVGLITGTLSTKLRYQILFSCQREAKVTALYKLSRDIAAVSDLSSVLDSVARNVADAIEGQVVLMIPNEEGVFQIRANSNPEKADFIFELEQTTSWVLQQFYKSTNDIGMLRKDSGLYFSLRTEQGLHGIMCVWTSDPEKKYLTEQLNLLEAFAGLAAIAINRVILADKARDALTFAQSEKLRTALFNSISHDLRTPLASIIGAVTGLLEEDDIYSAEARRGLLQTIQQGAARMHRFINNLLDMARLESGMLKLKKQWCDLQDVLGVAINTLGALLNTRQLKTKIEPTIPLVKLDFVLIEQVLVNVLDNAVKYSEPGSPITISVQQVVKDLQVAVFNFGARIPDQDLHKIFDKFYRLKSPLQVSGTGLGLAICRGIIEAHGGRIWAENNLSGGVAIKFSLPLDELPKGMPIICEGDENGE